MIVCCIGHHETGVPLPIWPAILDARSSPPRHSKGFKHPHSTRQEPSAAGCTGANGEGHNTTRQLHLAWSFEDDINVNIFETRSRFPRRKVYFLPNLGCCVIREGTNAADSSDVEHEQDLARRNAQSPGPYPPSSLRRRKLSWMPADATYLGRVQMWNHYAYNRQQSHELANTAFALPSSPEYRYGGASPYAMPINGQRADSMKRACNFLLLSRWSCKSALTQNRASLPWRAPSAIGAHQWQTGAHPASRPSIAPRSATCGQCRSQPAASAPLAA